MTLLLSCRTLTRSFGSHPLFEGLTFGLEEGERTGLIGPNGAGKSTLLRILAGLEKSDGGELSIRRGLRVGHLAQADLLAPAAEGETVRAALVRALEGLDLADWEVDARVEKALAESELDPAQSTARLSGGWRKRLMIQAQVIRAPDLLLLDEPTNHLDLRGVLWLERFLTGLDFSFLVVTHDRRFLESVCNRVIEINPRYAAGHFSSAGNYSDFLENREAHFDAQVSREASARNLVRREIAWLRKGAKARTTKQKARIERAGELIEDLAELAYRNSRGRTAAFDFSGSERKTKKLVEAIGMEKAMGGRKLFGPMNFILGPGDKLGLLGENGSGKSTLLKLLAGGLEPDAGRLKRAAALQVVTFDQQREQLDLSLTLKRALCEKGEFVEYKGVPIHVAGWADRFLFAKSQLHMPLGNLSGGEQARVLIARLMLRPADLLLLDEPTNDLDIHTLEVLESSMLDFPGALVLVTHDRYLLDRVSDRILALDGMGNGDFFADLDQWESWTAARAAGPRPAAFSAPPAPAAPTPGPAAPAKRPGLSYEESKELKKLSSRIRFVEAERDRLARRLEDPSIAADAEALQTRQRALEDAQMRVDALTRRWEELEARA